MAENKNTDIIEGQIVNQKATSNSSSKTFLAPDKIVNGISMAIGGLFILYAAYNFIAFYRSDKKASDSTKLIAGIAMVIAGIFLITQTSFIKDIISFVVGIFIIFESMIRLQDSLKLRKLNKDAAKIPLISSCISLICGVLCIMGKILIPDIFLQILGVMLIIFSFADIFGLFTVHKK